MTISVRPANLESDRERIISTLFRCLTPLSDSRRFNWLYRGNPQGEPRVWLAIDTDDGATVGMGSAFPRGVFIGDREELAWVLGDFCLQQEYRSLGPALKLQRTCFSEAESQRVAFCYDFPSTSMMSIYKRLHITPFGRMLRLAKPLRADRKIGELLGNSRLSRRLSAPANLLLSLSSRKTGRDRTLTTCIHEGNCDQEFSALARKIAGRYGVCIQRSAEYLNWRYLANPLYPYELLTARRRGALLAYAIFSQPDETGTLVDLFGLDDPGIMSTLIDSLVVLLRERGAISVSAAILDSHPWVPLLQQLGFRTREASPVVVYPPLRSPSAPNGLVGANFLLIHGDRDS
jgi:hypothetical protein